MSQDAPPPDALRSTLSRNLRSVRSSIAAAAARAGRDPGTVRILAVTKTVAAEAVRALAGAGVSVPGGTASVGGEGPGSDHPGGDVPDDDLRGIDAIGENRVQEAESKRSHLSDLGLRWHMIGGLQTNKVRRALEVFDRVDSLDRPSLMDALAAEGARRGRVVECLLQVNVSGERTKGGFAVDEAGGALRRARALPSLRVVGLMTIPAPVDDPEESRPAFRALRELRDSLRGDPSDLPELSMGMSDDYPVAVEEGATLVRLGSALFAGLPESLFGRTAAAAAGRGGGA